MKKPTKSIITSSLLAVAFGALSVGSTFALFTSQAETKIEVATGIVEVSASLSETEIKTYSAQEDINGDLVDEKGNKYSSVETAVNGVFTNTGTANYDTSTSVLTLKRLTPGDRVKLSLEASFGNTNVSIKYRYGIVVDQTKIELAKALDFTIQEGTNDAEPPYHGLVSYYSDWIFVSDPAHAEFGPLSFDISMPIKAGNQYQNLATSYLFTLQAVQGNAVTEGEKSYSVLGEDVVSAPQAVVENVDTTITAQTAQAEAASFKVTVPTSDPELTYSDGEEQKPIATDDKLTIEVAELGVTKETYSTNTSLNFDLTVKVNGEKANNFSKPLLVKINVGSGKIITSVQHNNVEVTDFQYDSGEGILSFSSSSFSPFSVDYVDGVEVWNYDELIIALNVNPAKPKRIGIKDTIDAGSNAIFISRSVEIFGVGEQKTLNSTATRIVRINASNVEVSLANIKFLDHTQERGIQVDSNMTGVTLKVEKCEVDVHYYALNFCASTVVDVVIKDSVLRGWAGLNIWSNGVSVDAYDTYFDCATISPGEAFAAICLEADTTGTIPSHSSDMVVNAYNCTFNIPGVYQFAVQFNNNASVGSTNNIVNLFGCDILKTEVIGHVTDEQEVMHDITWVSYDSGTNNTINIDDKTTLNGTASDFIAGNGKVYATLN